MDDRISELEARVEELEKVIVGFQCAMKRFVEDTSFSQPPENLVLYQMGEVVMSYRFTHIQIRVKVPAFAVMTRARLMVVYGTTRE